MSAVAGIVRLDGSPIEPGQVDSMTLVMRHRGPDGRRHWAGAGATLGHCAFNTTPESTRESLPLAHGQRGHVLVMDGRIDNRDELRRKLVAKGASLRDETDAELVMEAFGIWGDECPSHLVGEFVFLIWDARQRRLFGARDALGARHFYYYMGDGWLAFASEIKGLLALEAVPAELNESRLLEFLVPAFDRDEEAGTFYSGIFRLPAGSALAFSGKGLQTWRYWKPQDLAPLRFSSPADCAEGFAERLNDAVACRLRTHRKLGAMLSGGLDSSTVVASICGPLRDRVELPLQTYSLVRADRQNCKEWPAIDAMCAAFPLDPIVIDSEAGAAAGSTAFGRLGQADEPFALVNGLPYSIIYGAAAARGCAVLLDGIGGDLLFYGADQSFEAICNSRGWGHLQPVSAACRRHAIPKWRSRLVRAGLRTFAPPALLTVYRMAKGRLSATDPDLSLLQPQFARWLQGRRMQAVERNARLARGLSDLASHAQLFTSGLMPFAFEAYGPMAFSEGVETRSPYADRRLVEFAIRMPMQAKLFSQWYKLPMRMNPAVVLPDPVRWRQDLGQHPGWKFYERMIQQVSLRHPQHWRAHDIGVKLDRWVRAGRLRQLWQRYESHRDYGAGLELLNLAVLSRWLTSRHWSPPRPGGIRTSQKDRV